MPRDQRRQAVPPGGRPDDLQLPEWERRVPAVMLQRIVENAARALRAERGSLALREDGDELVTVATTPAPDRPWRSRFRPGEGIAGEVARTGQPIIVDDIEHEARFRRPGHRGIRALLCVPLVEAGRVLGTLTVSSSRPAAFEPDHLDLLTVCADQAALALVQARRVAEIARVEAVFLSTISHDLRAPVSSIRGFAELILTGHAGEVAPLARECARNIVELTGQLARLVEDIMQLSLAEAGQLRLMPMPTDLVALIDRALAHLHPRAAAAGVRVRRTRTGRLPPAVCDPARIEQVLVNLVGNALTFTPEDGSVTVSARVEAAGVRVRVRDTGPGIPRAEQARVFERFYRAADGPPGQHGGAGLGLTIVKQLVEAHGGRVGLTSRIGHGATFWFWLPLHPGDAPVQPER